MLISLEQQQESISVHKLPPQACQAVPSWKWFILVHEVRKKTNLPLIHKLVLDWVPRLAFHDVALGRLVSQGDGRYLWW